MQYITVLDYVLLPFVLAIVYGIAINFRNKHYRPRHPWRKYFIPALTVKIFGALFIGMIYQYYYGFGDTFYYFSHAKIINSSFQESPIKWINLVFHLPERLDPSYYQYTSQLFWYKDPSSYMVAAITSLVSIFTFNTYLPTATIFAFLSFSGVWALFRTFATIYPGLIKYLAIAIFFIPSVFVWGSGIFKDTICLFALGWMTYCTFRIFINKDFSIKNILILILSFYLIAVVKIYILIAFLPALGLWLLMSYSYKIKSAGVRLITNVFFILILGLSVVFVTNKFAKELNKYSLDNIATTAEVTRNWIQYSSGDEGSGYDLGTFDPSITGMLVKFPQAVIVTLYRPFLWEAKKILVLFSALESLAFTIFTIMILYKKKAKELLFTIKDPNMIFFLIFTLIFAFAVGISSYNFGSLSRYKIPCLPFFGMYLFILMYKNNSRQIIQKFKPSRRLQNS